MRVFFVTKKNGKLRFIAVARRANVLFRRPPRTVVGSMRSWSRISLAGRDGSSASASTLFVAQEDVRDYFFRLAMPEGLRDLFCLPHISADLLTKAFLLQGLAVPEEVFELGKTITAIAWRFQVLPMFCPWAFHLAHVAHEELATRSRPGIPFIRDRQPLPDLTKATAILVYADNCDHMGPDQVVVDSNRVTMSTHVNSLGLSTHGIVEASTEGRRLRYTTMG